MEYGNSDLKEVLIYWPSIVVADLTIAIVFNISRLQKLKKNQHHSSVQVCVVKEITYNFFFPL